MPIFTLDNSKAKKVAPKKVALEKDIQGVFESNLEEILDIHFLASEYTTSFGGRIDTLGIDNNRSPVIIEYKRTRNDNVINQALSYLKWLLDHKAEFEKLVSQKLGNKWDSPVALWDGDGSDLNNLVEWQSPRVLCIAQQFNKFDLDTVEVLPLNIELIRFKVYENNILQIDSESASENRLSLQIGSTKQKHTIKEVKAYSVEEHLSNATDETREIYKALREKLVELDESILEEPKAKYIAFKLTTNFVDVTIQKEALKLFINMPKGSLDDPSSLARDVSSVGHWGNGDYEVKLENIDQLEQVFELILQSYNHNS